MPASRLTNHSSSADDDLPRDPEDRSPHDEREVKDKMLDKTIADSFPASDPPSSIPDPDDDSFAA